MSIVITLSCIFSVVLVVVMVGVVIFIIEVQVYFLGF